MSIILLINNGDVPVSTDRSNLVLQVRESEPLNSEKQITAKRREDEQSENEQLALAA